MPLTSCINGYTGVIWPRTSAYRSSFIDPATFVPPSAEDLENQILEAIEAVYDEVKTGDTEAKSTVYEAITSTQQSLKSCSTARSKSSYRLSHRSRPLDAQSVFEHTSQRTR